MPVVDPTGYPRDVLCSFWVTHRCDYLSLGFVIVVVMKCR